MYSIIRMREQTLTCICISDNKTLPSLVIFSWPAPSTNILRVPLGPKFDFTTWASPVAPVQFKLKACWRLTCSALGFNNSMADLWITELVSVEWELERGAYMVIRVNWEWNGKEREMNRVWTSRSLLQPVPLTHPTQIDGIYFYSLTSEGCSYFIDWNLFLSAFQLSILFLFITSHHSRYTITTQSSLWWTRYEGWDGREVESEVDFDGGSIIVGIER